MEALTPVDHAGRRPEITQQVQLDLQNAALEMRRRGMSHRAIGEALGISHTTVWNYTTGYMLENVAHNVEAFREQHTEVTQVEMTALWPAVLAGDTDAIRTMTAVLARQAKLMGADMPEKVEQVLHVDTAEDAELRELLAQARARRDSIEGEVVEQ